MTRRRGGGDLSDLSLADIRERLLAAPTPSAEGRLLSALRRDRRQGARCLAEAAEKRVRARRAEARRLSRLFTLRRKLFSEGVETVAGVDEVGVGPLAGPVVAAAVVLPVRVRLRGLNDSKQVTRADRERLDREIREQAVSVCVAEVSVEDVDRLNILRASLEAMRLAVTGLSLVPDHVLVDARMIPDIEIPQTPLIGGDGRDASIAAASIVAKVYRDALMQRLDLVHPGYGFARHKGYATPEHLTALSRLGPSVLHRRSFAPVSQLPPL